MAYGVSLTVTNISGGILTIEESAGWSFLVLSGTGVASPYRTRGPLVIPVGGNIELGFNADVQWSYEAGVIRSYIGGGQATGVLSGSFVYSVSDSLVLPPGMGGPANFSANMKSYQVGLNTSIWEPYVRLEADGSTSTGEFGLYLVIPPRFLSVDTDGFTIKYQISDNTGDNQVGAKIQKNESEVYSEALANPSSTDAETLTITAADLSGGAVSFAAGDRVVVRVDVSLADGETLDIFPVTFDYTMDPTA